jgi:hypothetical protein
MLVTQDDVVHARELYNAGNYAGMYNHLATRGDRYAILANGVVQGNTFSGVMALEHLENVARDSGLPWSQADVNVVRDRMADAYLDYLEQRTVGGQPLAEQINAQAVWDMHSDVMQSTGLPPGAWTLDRPFDSMTNEQRNEYWNDTLDRAGDSIAEVQSAVEAVAAVSGNLRDPGSREWLLDFLSPDSIADALEGTGVDLNDFSERVADAVFEETESALVASVLRAMLDMPAYAMAGIGELLDLFSGDDIPIEVSDLFDLAQQWRERRDPLVLDLNGNGIETIAPDATNSILFDHTGSGIRTGTGWVSPSDGFLVMDRNGNGTIDTGAELFGDSTPLANGSLASDGFAALADLDSNQDSQITVADAQFASLRVWRDLNQDGVSQSGELFTLAAAGVASLSLVHTTGVTTLPNGNTIGAQGTFTRSDGSTSAMDGVDMADLNLLQDTFHREFTDSIPLAPGVDDLPNMRGSGQVRDLWEAVRVRRRLVTRSVRPGVTRRPSQRSVLRAA